MSKTNIIFNNKDYSVEDSFLSTHSADLKSHFSSVMSGSGAVINLGGVAYNIDATKLAAAQNAFIQHLGTIAGSGHKIVIGGVEYGIDSGKVAGAISEIEDVLDGSISGGGEEENFIGAKFSDGVILSWDELKLEENGTKYGYKHDKISDVGIGDGAFYGCRSLTSINIPDSVTSIGGMAFDNCTNLTSVNISDGVTSIGDSVFYKCSNLTSINIPDGVTSIGDGAFYCCSSLTSINIPDGVTSIGGFTFYNCTNLTSIVYAGTIAQWNAITKGGSWKVKVLATYVQCSDGQVEL